MKLGFYYAFMSLNTKLDELSSSQESGPEEPSYLKSLMYRGWSNWKSFKPSVLPLFTRLFHIDKGSGEELNWPRKEVRYYLSAGKLKKAFNVILAFNLDNQFLDEVSNNEAFSRRKRITRIKN